mmetsp:Transcript_16782/g.36604  ORF Transcript_16782/g.36604 Transcript_16782/m.36604 type:complete len:353 (+) Transcript_16782:375-1433(+)
MLSNLLQGQLRGHGRATDSRDTTNRPRSHLPPDVLHDGKQQGFFPRTGFLGQCHGSPRGGFRSLCHGPSHEDRWDHHRCRQRRWNRAGTPHPPGKMPRSVAPGPGNRQDAGNGRGHEVPRPPADGRFLFQQQERLLRTTDATRENERNPKILQRRLGHHGIGESVRRVLGRRSHGGLGECQGVGDREPHQHNRHDLDQGGANATLERVVQGGTDTQEGYRWQRRGPGRIASGSLGQRTRRLRDAGERHLVHRLSRTPCLAPPVRALWRAAHQPRGRRRLAPVVGALSSQTPSRGPGIVAPGLVFVPGKGPDLAALSSGLFRTFPGTNPLVRGLRLETIRWCRRLRQRRQRQR